VKTAILTLVNFRALFTRIPIRGGGLSKYETLAFDCKEFARIGSFGESKFAESSDVEKEPSLKEWVVGLRQGGGGG